MGGEDTVNADVWLLAVYKHLKSLGGGGGSQIHNCMRGGRRKKLSRFLFFPASLGRYLDRTCDGPYDGACQATGLPHRPRSRMAVWWASFPTEGEAEYPPGLAVSIARGVRRTLTVRPSCVGLQRDPLGAEGAKL